MNGDSSLLVLSLYHANSHTRTLIKHARPCIRTCIYHLGPQNTGSTKPRALSIHMRALCPAWRAVYRSHSPKVYAGCTRYLNTCAGKHEEDKETIGDTHIALRGYGRPEKRRRKRERKRRSLLTSTSTHTHSVSEYQIKIIRTRAVRRI